MPRSELKKKVYRLLYGRHSEIVDGARVNMEPGDTIATNVDLVRKFKNKFELLASDRSLSTEVEDAVESNPTGLKLKLVHRGAGRYCVVNEITGKPVHDGLLAKSDALDLIEQLGPQKEEEE